MFRQAEVAQRMYRHSGTAPTVFITHQHVEKENIKRKTQANKSLKI